MQIILSVAFYLGWNLFENIYTGSAGHIFQRFTG